ncbi:hypothetical protein [Methanosarcina sp.]|uniref:hypothetical protein n=1 Tax=Methanosarcina sp. TaxID=2213 RepID=UPI003BB56CE6
MLSMLSIGTEGFAAGNSFPGSGICFLYTDFGIPLYYQITVLGLIALIGIKEMVMVSTRKDQLSIDSMDMGIYPLLICFIANFFFMGVGIIFSQLMP